MFYIYMYVKIILGIHPRSDCVHTSKFHIAIVMKLGPATGLVNACDRPACGTKFIDRLSTGLPQACYMRVIFDRPAISLLQACEKLYRPVACPYQACHRLILCKG